MITIVDYGAGNITSVQRALSFLGIENEITDAPNKILNAERILFPGVGHAGAAMAQLHKTGLSKAMQEAYTAKIPILGICLGTQIIFSYSEEGDVPCLSLVPGKTVHFPKDMGLKIPHMGWNEIHIQQPHPVIPDAVASYYFVHSYYVKPDFEQNIVATCNYGIEFPAIIAKDNLIATQFHPEKSGKAGLAILERFAKWKGDDNHA